MSIRPITSAALLITALATLPGCTTDAATTTGAAADPSPSSSSSDAPGDELVGTFRTRPVSLTRMARVARREGFARADVREYLDGSFGDAKRVRYILEVSETHWVVFMEVDGGDAVDIWAGPYEVVDDTTVVAGSPPCGPITVEYRIRGAALDLEMTDSDCLENGVTPPGELIAGATIYQSAPWHRVR